MKALHSIPRFIRFKLEPKVGRKPDKVPCNESGYRIDATDSQFWQRWEDVQGSEHIGFVLNGDGVCCLDLDHCLPKATGAQLAVAQFFSNAAIEQSFSGDGLHLWFKTDFQQTIVNHDVNVEFYPTKRFIAFGKPIRDIELPFYEGESVRVLFETLGILKPGFYEVTELKQSTEDTTELLNWVTSGSFGKEHAKRLSGDLSLENGDWSKTVMRLLSAMTWHAKRHGKTKDLVYQTILTCEDLLKLRPTERYMKKVGNQTWLEYEIDYVS